MRDLARRLLAASPSSANSGAESGPRVHEALTVCETLRTVLTKTTGPDGFAALVRRALALASVEAPELRNVRVGTNGQFEGFEEIVAQNGGTDAAAELTAQLLTLLAIFIGEELMLRLVLEGWPDLGFELETKGGST